MVILEDFLKAIVLRNSDFQQKEWFSNVCLTLENQFNQKIFRSAFVGMARRFSGRLKELLKEDLDELGKFDSLCIDKWQLYDFGRIALLIQVMKQISNKNHLPLLNELYRRGDHSEQSSILKALSILPEPERFIDLATEACRTNALIVFEAVACENLFPANYFSDLNFNQMVLKSLFLNISVNRIAGLNLRTNDNLIKMIKDFKEERRLADRALSKDVEEMLSKICSHNP